MRDSFNKVFWGFIIVLFNINIGPINLMPDFLGYYIMSSGLYGVIHKFESNNIKTARAVINFLFVYTLFASILKFIGYEEYFYNNFISYKSIISLSLTMVINLIRLIATFKILSGAMEVYLFNERQSDAVIIEGSQKNYTVLSLVALVGIAFSLNSSSEYYSIAAAVFFISVQIYYAVLLNRMRHDFNKDLI